MGCRIVVLGVVSLLGYAVESLADPVDLSRLNGAATAVFLELHLNEELPPLELALEATVGTARLDAPVSFNASELVGSRNNFDSLSLPPTAPPDWSVRGTGSPAGQPPKHGLDKLTPRKPKDTCDGSPCPTTVPEPATAMLLVIGMGLAGVASRYRLRL
jgi:PEP-CTERM motif-containing protein